MKRNLLLLAVMVVATLLFATNSWAAQDPNDPGKPDSVWAKTVGCDHTYEQGPGGYDQVRVTVYVSHDSNTIEYEGQPGRWVQDSVAAIVIPFAFWHQPAGHADSVILPNMVVDSFYDPDNDEWKMVRYNNPETDAGYLGYSIFRDIVCPPADTTKHRMKALKWGTKILDIESHSCDHDSGHAWLALIAGGDKRKWTWGSDVPLATLTFFVYMNPAYDTTEIGLDIMPNVEDQYKLSFTRYDAVGYVPIAVFPVKDTIYIVPNQPPDITCGGTYTTHKADVVAGFDVTDAENDFVTLSYTMTPVGGGVAVLNPLSGTPPLAGTFTYTPDCSADKGKTFTVWVKAADAYNKDSCSFTISVTNQPPIVHCPDNAEIRWDKIYTGSGTYSDPEGDDVDVVFCGVDPAPAHNPVVIDKGSGKFDVTWQPAATDSGIIYTVTVCAIDQCGDTARCTFTLLAVPPPPGEPGTAEIPSNVFCDSPTGPCDDCVNPGELFYIPVIVSPPKDADHGGMGGFELELEFDYLDLTFFGAERGSMLKDTATIDGIFYSWEYFTYRVLPCPLCACCKYKILLYGQAEMPNGPTKLGYCPPDYVVQHEVPPTDLVWLKFQVANNDLLRGLCLPINWEWEAKLDAQGNIILDWDCAENTMASCDGQVLFVSDNLKQYDPDICSEIPEQHPVAQILTFTDGCIYICPPGPGFKCTRGDINLDHIANTTADAVLFANYFVHGMTVFYPEPERTWQICATDVNADGRTLMLADLIYLIRVIQQDAVPFPKLGPSSDVANVIVSDGRIAVECASAIGGILFKFDGAVTPTLLNANMELLSNEGNVLVWSSEGHSINAGASQLLTASGAELVSVIAVDREGRDLATTITTKLAPTAFALHAAYPNPFNPNTNLSFTLPNAVSYSMNIYNVAGQLVRSYQGMGIVGLNVITWDGKDNAGNDVSSGVYFYKLIAGSYTATNKMVMMK
jgi:hypothetical protein